MSCTQILCPQGILAILSVRSVRSRYPKSRVISYNLDISDTLEILKYPFKLCIYSEGVLRCHNRYHTYNMPLCIIVCCGFLWVFIFCRCNLCINLRCMLLYCCTADVVQCFLSHCVIVLDTVSLHWRSNNY